MTDQISIFDITGEKPAPTLRVHFKNFYGMRQYIDVGLSDDSKKSISEALAKCRANHNDLYFQFYEVIK